MEKTFGSYAWRTVAVLVFCAIIFATCLSLLSNRQPKWFDWVAAAPLLYIFTSLAIFKSDSALVEELDSTLIRIKRIFGQRAALDLRTGTPMREALIASTEAAIRGVDAARFFQTERGFQGRFYCALQQELDRAGLMKNGIILEMEYQKSARHGLGQRPDIVLHVPAEHSGAGVNVGNFAVWALKRQATAADARDDFGKLDQMFGTLQYPLGFFVNIDAMDPMRQHYAGPYPNRLVAVATSRNGTEVAINRVDPDAEAEPLIQADGCDAVKFPR